MKGKNMRKIDLDHMASMISEKRKEYGYTMEQMSEQSGLAYGYYVRIEKGHTMPSLQALAEIADILHLSLDSLVFGRSAEG